MTIDLGQTIDGKYRVVRHIGAGGMGTVYEGENVLIGRRVAIKLLHAQVASMPEFVERFEREARAAVRIGSPHICDVLDLGHMPNGDRFIVMEYLEGVSLEDRLEERGKLAPHELAPIAFELLEGLGSMHGAGVVHRDLKPANIFLAKARGGRGETVKILDFGVAKLQPKPGEVGAMTQTGAMMGTPLYMSPEQARGARDVDGRSDIYSASVIFYRALTGELPYMAQNLNELLFKIVLEDPRPIRDLAPEVDEAFAEIVHRGLTRDVEKRFPGARAFQEAIATWGRAQGRPSLAFAITMRTEPPPRAVRPSAPDAMPVGSAPKIESAPMTSTPGTVVYDDLGPRPPTPAGSGPVAGPTTPLGLGSGSGESPVVAQAAISPAAGTPLSWSGAPDGLRGSNPSIPSGAMPVAAHSSQRVRAAGEISSFASTQASPSDPKLRVDMPTPAGATTAASTEDAAAAAPAPAKKGSSRAIAFAAGALALVAGLGFVVSRSGRGAAATDPAAAAATSSVTTATVTPTSTSTAAPADAAAAVLVATTTPPVAASDAGAPHVAARPTSVTTTSAATAPKGTTPPTSTGTATPTAAATAVGAATPPATATAAAPATTASSHGRRFRTNLD